MKEINPYDIPEPVHPNSEIVPEGNRKCPICGKLMVPNEKEGVSVDICEKHGIWLDKKELPRIIYRVKYNERNAHNLETKRAKREYKMHGICLGWLSLLLK